MKRELLDKVTDVGASAAQLEAGVGRVDLVDGIR
jgi:hypothetical protein